MFRNVDREGKVYNHWKEGKTIDQISLLEGIPRSSVGYYVRKFRKSKGVISAGFRMPPKPEGREEKIHLALSFLKRVAKMIKENRFREANEMAEAYFALMKLVRELSENVNAGRSTPEILAYVCEELGLDDLTETMKWVVMMESLKMRMPNHDEA